MYLVSTHAQVSRVAEQLLDRTLNALVEDLAEEALRCFRQVKRFGMGGMLRVSPLLRTLFLEEANTCTTLNTERRPLKLSSCTRPSRAMYPPPPPRHSPICTIKSPRRTRAGQATRICRAILMVSRRRWRRQDAQLGSSSSVSDRRNSLHPPALVPAAFADPKKASRLTEPGYKNAFAYYNNMYNECKDGSLSAQANKST